MAPPPSPALRSTDPPIKGGDRQEGNLPFAKARQLTIPPCGGIGRAQPVRGGQSAPPVGPESLRHREDGVADRGPIGHHLVIGESQHGETAGFKPVLTHVVVLVVLLATVCPTVQLDEQLLGKTHDVDDVRPYRLLSPELVSELPHSKIRPCSPTLSPKCQ